MLRFNSYFVTHARPRNTVVWLALPLGLARRAVGAGRRGVCAVRCRVAVACGAGNRTVNIVQSGETGVAVERFTIDITCTSAIPTGNSMPGSDAGS